MKNKELKRRVKRMDRDILKIIGIIHFQRDRIDGLCERVEELEDDMSALENSVGPEPLPGTLQHAAWSMAQKDKPQCENVIPKERSLYTNE